MNLHDPTTVLLIGVFMVGFVAGVVFAGAVVWIETRKWRLSFIGDDPAGSDDGCTVYGHYDARGVLHIDRVEMDGSSARTKPR